MSYQREICAVYNTVAIDFVGALDSILHAIEIAMDDESISKEKGAIQNDKAK